MTYRTVVATEWHCDRCHRHTVVVSSTGLRPSGWSTGRRGEDLCHACTDNR